MKQRVVRWTGFLSLYFISIVYSAAQTDTHVQKDHESVSSIGPLYVQAFDLTQSFDGKIQLVNQDLKSDLNGYELEWSIERIDAWNGAQLLFSDRISLENIEAEPYTEISLDLPANWKEGDVLNLSLFGKDGALNYSLSEPIRMPKEGNQNYFKQRLPLENQPILVRESTVDFQIAAGENLYIFSKQKGNLELVKIGRRFVNFSQTIEEGLFSSAIQKLTWKRLKDGSVQIKSTYQSNSKELAWTVLPNGELKVEIFSNEALADLGALEFAFPEEKVKYAQWIGEGANRENERNHFGIWKKDLKDLLAERDFDSDSRVSYPYIHALFLETDDGSIEVRSETPSVYLSLDKPAVMDNSTEQSDRIALASELKLYFSISKDFSPLNTSSASIIPVNLKVNKTELSSSMVMWFRFN
ncbi:hypothetical protein [uncultured Algoriphagus sp.]|uniref:hypothetical protein n=1 Tax=uncultured Algoriphagus sp. TaxID=417365 RepID=UPI0030ED3E35|tara:strand:- start:70410 stop:71648 length:1239 start_codon:yes stop_codon:yes gene_type:complete